jgi:hypothetical protein
MEKEIEEKIQKTQLSIENLTTELSQQRSLRRHREECENLAKIVNSLPSRTESEQKIRQIDEEIQRIKEQIQDKERLEALRSRQFKLIGQAIYEMSRSLEEETATQAQLQLYQQQLLQATADPGEGEGDDGDGDDPDGEEDREVGDKRTAKSEQIEQRESKKQKKGEDEGVEGEGDGEAEKEENRGDVGDEEPKEKELSVPLSQPSSTANSSPRSAQLQLNPIRSPRGASSLTPRIQQQTEPEEGEEEEGPKEEDNMEIIK